MKPKAPKKKDIKPNCKSGKVKEVFEPISEKEIKAMFIELLIKRYINTYW